MQTKVVVNITITPIAKEALTRSEIDSVIQRLLDFASTQPNWQPGKSVRDDFTKNGRGFSIALDYRKDGFHAIVGLPQEVIGPWPVNQWPGPYLNHERNPQ